MPELRTLPIGKTIGIILQFAVGAGLLALLSSMVDLRQIGRLLLGAKLMPLIAALLLLALDFLLRAMRFREMLTAASGTPMPLRSLVAPFVASFGISDLLPLRIGDGFRLVWFSRQCAMPFGAVVGAMIVERLMDLTAILVLGVIGFVGMHPEVLGAHRDLVLVGALGLAVALLAAQRLMLLAQRWLLRMQAGRETFLSRQAGLAITTIETVRQLAARRYAAGLTLLSVLIWMIEAGVMFCTWASLGDAPVSPFVLLFAFASATIATLFPSLPGHFGTFEFAGVEAFALAGTDRSTAAAAVLLTHILLWAPIALFAIGWLVRRMSYGMRPFAAG